MSIDFYPCYASLDLEILRQFSMHFVIANSYMINQKFMKLCTLQDPNMKMYTLVGYPGSLSFTPVMPLWTFLRQFSMHFVIANSPT